MEDLGLIPVLGRSPGNGNGYPCQYSCLENSMERGAWWAYSAWGCKESDMTERLSTAQHRGYQVVSHCGFDFYFSRD